MTLSIDFETRSKLNLKLTGAYRYLADASTDLWCMAYAFGEEEPSLWVPGDPVPPRVPEHVRAGGEIRAWNAAFERLAWWFILTPRYGFPGPKLEQFVCTAAEGSAMALPRALEDAAKVLGVAEQKDMAGRRIILQLARPKKDGTFNHDPEKIALLYEACKQDVRTERAVAAKVRRLSAYEQRVYWFDQRVNDRGLPVDVELARAMDKLVDKAVESANEELTQITGGAVSKVTQAGRLKTWLNKQGVGAENVARATVTELLGQEHGADVDRALQLRFENGRSSLAKLKRIPSVAGRDGRVRGTMLYHGASTGRWAGKLLQPQNFPRGEVDDVERYIPAILAGDVPETEVPLLVVLSSMLRKLFKARDGHRLMEADFSQIEARITAWFAEQDDLLAAFASGAKIYEEMGAQVYGVPVESIGKDSVERQVGKGQVLGCGFGMGWEKFRNRMAELGVTLSDEQAQAAVDGYRERFTRIPALWQLLDEAAFNAVRHPGQVFRAGRNGNVAYVKHPRVLWCVLPSGRPLAYMDPEIVTKRKTLTDRNGKKYTRAVTTVEFSTVSSTTRKWVRRDLYGGLLTENIAQAAARDIMVASMLRSDAAGYPTVLTVHDSVMAEVPNGRGSFNEFLALMARAPAWAVGLPVAVDGWEGERYKNEGLLQR